MAKDKVGKRERHNGVCCAESSKDNVFLSSLSSSAAWAMEHEGHLGHLYSLFLISCPRTYFEVKDIRPGEEEMQCITDEIFVSTAGGISIPKELNRNILQFLTGKDLLRFTMVSKKANMIVKHCHR